MNYLEWNDAIASHFFRPDMAYRRVFLAVTEAVIDEIGKDHRVGKDDFLRAIRTGPPWTLSEPDICSKAVATNLKWRLLKLPYPPYIAFLSVFVMAADSHQGFASQDYYGPLSELLQQRVGLKQFEPIHALWYDLRNWSRRDKEDTLGIFRPGIPAGSRYTNVGLPRSQTLLLSAEREALPQFFNDNNLDPTSIPTEAALIRALSRASFLRPSTQRILTNNNSRELQSALAEFVLDELQAWDGSVDTTTRTTSKGTSSFQTTAILRLCLKINALAGRVDATARFKANRRFPDGALNLEDSVTGDIWLGRESQDGWSWPLARQEDNRKITLDASKLNWSSCKIFRDRELGWRIVLSAASVRLFLPGRREGLDIDWVESSHLVPGCSFCVACLFDERVSIESWGRDHCETFEPLNLSGIPPGWALFRGENARSSQTDFDLLRLSARRRLRLVGGIKAEGRNSYFHFDRPSITLDGGNGTEKVSCTRSTLIGDTNGLWRFGNDVPIDETLRVECGEESLTLILRPLELCLKYDPPSLDLWGALTKEDGIVRGVEAPEDGLQKPPTDIPTHLGGHIIFLGRRAGELADWPKESLPRDWSPVWAIVKVRRDEWRAHFVGVSSNFSEIRQSKQGHWRDWKEFYLRRKTEAVGIKRVRDFWTQCCKEAKQL